MRVIWWILLGVLIVIACIPLTLLIAPIRIKIECVHGWRFSVYIVGIRVFRMSSPFDFSFGEEEEKTTEQKPEQPKKSEPQGEEKKTSSFLDTLRSFFDEEGVGGVLDFFKQLYDLFAKTAGSAKRFVTVRKLSLCVRVGADDAKDTALYYAAVSSAISVAFSALASVVRIKRPLVRVVPDFLSPSSDVKMRMVLWIWPLGMLLSFAVMGVRAAVLWFTTIGKPRQNTNTHMVQS